MYFCYAHVRATHPVFATLRAVWNSNGLAVGVTMYWPSTTVTSAPRLVNLEVMKSFVYDVCSDWTTMLLVRRAAVGWTGRTDSSWDSGVFAPVPLEDMIVFCGIKSC